MKKACPVVFRYASTHLLVFKHPHAGIQLVKGTVEPGESIDNACSRELREESGLDAYAADALPRLRLATDQLWHFRVMSLRNTPPDNWTFHTEDGGGLNFEFFWHPLDMTTDHNWHPIYKLALSHIKSHIGGQFRASDKKRPSDEIEAH